MSLLSLRIHPTDRIKHTLHAVRWIDGAYDSSLVSRSNELSIYIIIGLTILCSEDNRIDNELRFKILKSKTIGKAIDQLTPLWINNSELFTMLKMYLETGGKDPSNINDVNNPVIRIIQDMVKSIVHQNIGR